MSPLVKYSIGLILLSVFFHSEGQFNFRDGYIISLENDTISGKIKDRGEIRNSKTCLFRAVNSSKAVKYHPTDIKSYRFSGDKYFRSQQLNVNGERRKVFANVLLEGKINLYHYRKDKNRSYFIERDDGVLTGLKNADLLLQQKSGYGHMAYAGYTRIKIPVYRDTLFSFFQDSPEIQKQVSGIKYNQEDLQSITKKYINETCEGNDCIIYERDVYRYRQRFGFYTGIQFRKIQFTGFKEYDSPEIQDPNVNSSILTTYPLGIFYNFPLFLFSDRLSFQLELTTVSFDFEQYFSDPSLIYNYVKINSRTLGIPLMLKYEISGKTISPSLAIGKTTSFVLNSKVEIKTGNELDNDNNTDPLLHTTEKGGWFFEFGLDYKLGSRISLFNSFRFQSFKNLIISQLNSNPYYNYLLENGDYQMEYKTNMATIIVGIKF